MRIRKYSGRVVLVIFLLAIPFFLQGKGIVHFTGKYKAAARGEVCRLAALIKPGDTYQAIEEVFHASGFKYLKRTNKIQGALVYTTPVELPSLTSQWELVVLGENAVAQELVVRDVDGKVRSCPGGG